MGINVVPMASIGADNFGDLLLSKLNELNTQHIHRGQHSTSYTIIVAPPYTDRMYIHSSGANDYFSNETIDYSVVNKAKIFHVGYPPLMKSIYQDNGDELKKIFINAKTLTSLDMSWPDPESKSGEIDWIKWLENVLPYVDFFLPTKNEICSMLHMGMATPYSVIAERCLDMGCKLVGIKDGENGIYAKTNGIQHWKAEELLIPSCATNVVNAVGAGDVCIAGFLAGFIKGETFETSLKVSQVAAAKSVESMNAFDMIIDFDSLLSLLK
jgi:sugar/nucleoside kinase (ribokinase family)